MPYIAKFSFAHDALRFGGPEFGSCPLLALNCRDGELRSRQLSGVKRTPQFDRAANDP
jgi:hypothetical protein